MRFSFDLKGMRKRFIYFVALFIQVGSPSPWRCTSRRWSERLWWDSESCFPVLCPLWTEPKHVRKICWSIAATHDIWVHYRRCSTLNCIQTNICWPVGRYAFIPVKHHHCINSLSSHKKQLVTTRHHPQCGLSAVEVYNSYVETFRFEMNILNRNKYLFWHLGVFRNVKTDACMILWCHIFQCALHESVAGGWRLGTLVHLLCVLSLLPVPGLRLHRAAQERGPAGESHTLWPTCCWSNQWCSILAQIFMHL